MAEGWKMCCLEPQVSEDHRQPDIQQKIGSSEGLEKERAELWYIRTFSSMSFSF